MGPLLFGFVDELVKLGTGAVGAPSGGSSIGPIKPIKPIKPMKPMTATAYGIGGKANVPMKMASLLRRKVTPAEKVNFRDTYSVVDSNNPQVHLKALANPKVSQDILAELVFSKNPEVRKRALVHPALHPQARERYRSLYKSK